MQIQILKTSAAYYEYYYYCYYLIVYFTCSISHIIYGTN